MKFGQLSMTTLLDSVSGHLEAHLRQKKQPSSPDSTASQPYAGIIFSGNPHETVPRRLLLDDRLTPLERNTWQVFRLLINDDGLTAFPTYDQLRPYLGMQPGKLASRETISKALVTLRLTRWLSLGRRVRNDLTGQVQGNVYLLHDEPVTPAEAMELDKDYLQLLAQSMEHQTKVIREVATIAWNEFAGDPDVGQRLPSRLDIVESRLNQQSWVKPSSETALARPEFGIRTQLKAPQFSLSSDTELSDLAPLTETSTLSSASELSGETRSTDSVRHPNSYSTYTNTNNDVCKSFVHTPPACDETSAEFLQTLQRLPADQKMSALQAMQKIPPESRPGLITQWVHRCESGSVRNPLGYLLTLIDKAIRGDFNSTWAPGDSDASHGQPPNSPANRNVEHLARTRADLPDNEPTLPRSAEAMQTAKQQINQMRHLLRPRQGIQT